MPQHSVGIVGRKTEASKRRVPSEHADPVDAASKRLSRFLDDRSVDDPRNVVHSLQHRAKDRLRAFECPDKMQQWLLGHDEKTVADSYGNGPLVAVLKKWIEKIRFTATPQRLADESDAGHTLGQISRGRSEAW